MPNNQNESATGSGAPPNQGAAQPIASSSESSEASTEDSASSDSDINKSASFPTVHGMSLGTSFRDMMRKRRGY